VSVSVEGRPVARRLATLDQATGASRWRLATPKGVQPLAGHSCLPEFAAYIAERDYQRHRIER
jgi:hypothetical protein